MILFKQALKRREELIWGEGGADRADMGGLKKEEEAENLRGKNKVEHGREKQG